MIKQTTISFLKTLAKNNTKIWFDEHRNSYLEAKKDYEEFVSSLIKKISAFDPEIKELQAKNCTFRLNRDIRFSKDKTPYKINMGASFNRGGKKSIYGGYYFHLEPGNKSFAGGGLWMPMVPELKKIRQEIDYNFEELMSIVNDKKFIAHFKKVDTSEEVKLVNVPRGYEKTNPASDYLKLKSFVAFKNISDAELVNPALCTETGKTFQALKPFITFLNHALG